MFLHGDQNLLVQHFYMEYNLLLGAQFVLGVQLFFTWNPNFYLAYYCIPEVQLVTRAQLFTCSTAFSGEQCFYMEIKI